MDIFVERGQTGHFWGLRLATYTEDSSTIHADCPPTDLRLQYECSMDWYGLDRVYGCATINFSFLNKFKNFFSLPDRTRSSKMYYILQGILYGFGHVLSQLPTYDQKHS